MSGLHALMTDHGSEFTNGSRSSQVIVLPRAEHSRAVVSGATSASDPDTTALALSAAHPILGKLPEQARRALLRWSRFRFVKRREAVWHQGDLAGNVILVVDGYLKQWTSLSDGSEVLLGLVGPGDCAGEATTLLERAHDANLTALSQCLLLMIDARQFRHAFEREPGALLAITRSTTEQLQRMTGQLLDGRAQSTLGRLAKVLLCLPRFPPSDAGGPTRLRLRLSQSELGAMAGICREVVNRYLGIWRDAGWIEMSGGAVTSFDMAAIFNLARDETFAESGTAGFSPDHNDQLRPRQVKNA